MAKRFNPFDIYSSQDDIHDIIVKNFSQIRQEGNDFPDTDQPAAALHIAVNLKIIQIIFILFACCLIILFVKTLWLQLIRGNDLRAAAEDNRIRIQTISAPRGILYDARGNLLVHNVPNFSIFAIPADLPKEQPAQEKIYKKIAEILNINPVEINQLLITAQDYSYQPVKLAERITYEKAILLNIESINLPGIHFEAKATREYLSDPSMSNVLGYTGSLTKAEYADYQKHDYQYNDYIGKTGIEKQYEQELKGLDGKEQIEVDSLGKEKKILASSDPISGKNITLTINQDLQKTIANLLTKTIERIGSPGGAAVALDPRNGEVLALVSIPSYDNNVFVLGLSDNEFQEIIKNPNNPLFNRPILGEYPSGSTIKPVIAAAALQEGIITNNTTVMSVGGIRIGDFYYPDWKAGGHGKTDVKKALAESVNTFFYYIGGGYEDFQGLGVTRMTDYFKRFGLGQKTGIDLPQEASGIIPDEETRKANNREWYLGDTYHLSIGQGDILVTPLQVALYTAAIANGGTINQPHLVKELVDPLTEQKQVVNAKVLTNQFINPNNINTVKQGLRQAVLNGSARGLASLPVAAAGKTGTAQFGTENKTHAWFTCFAPYDTPEIVLTIIVEEGGEGSATALPIAREILNWYFTQS